jgi:hypothetical protein
MQSPYERVYVTIVEVNRADSFPFHPSGKSSGNRSLLAKRSLCVTSISKVLKEGFYHQAGAAAPCWSQLWTSSISL